MTRFVGFSDVGGQWVHPPSWVVQSVSVGLLSFAAAVYLDRPIHLFIPCLNRKVHHRAFKDHRQHGFYLRDWRV